MQKKVLPLVLLVLFSLVFSACLKSRPTEASSDSLSAFGYYPECEKENPNSEMYTGIYKNMSKELKITSVANWACGAPANTTYADVLNYYSDKAESNGWTLASQEEVWMVFTKNEATLVVYTYPYGMDNTVAKIVLIVGY